MSDIVHYNANDMERNGIKVLFDEETNLVGFDFSAHDKVFEDKIAKLEKELEEWKEEARVVKKQRDEQLKSFRKGIEPYVDLLHMHETIAELKQHIDELESKEIKKIMRIEFHADNGEMLTPLEVANSLINQNTFKVDELRELSEFLQVYCNHHEDRDIEPNIMLF